MRVSGGGEQASSQIQSGRQGSRGRPKKQGNKNQRGGGKVNQEGGGEGNQGGGGEGNQGGGGEGNQGGGGEGNQGGAGEGNQEDREEEPDNNNDPNFQTPRRKRPHSVDREEVDGGGGDDEGGVRHIAAQVPVNILEITAGLAVMEKMSVRQHLMFLSGVLRACGVDLNDLPLSLSTAYRYRESECERIGHSTLENFVQQVEEDNGVKLVAHFDGKILNHDMGGKTGTSERMETLVNGPLVKKAQPLAAIPMNSCSGYQSAVAVSEVLRENRLDSRIVGVVADTCAVNFGQTEGAVYHLAAILDRQLLYLECNHHAEDLVPKAVKKVLVGRSSTSPTDHVISTWQKEFVKVQDEVRGDDFVLNTFDWQLVAEHPRVEAAVLATREWARQARRDKQFDKNDYGSLVNAILVYLGDVVPGYIIPRPAKVTLNSYFHYQINTLH